jgi:hypothetical protein
MAEKLNTNRRGLPSRGLPSMLNSVRIVSYYILYTTLYFTLKLKWRPDISDGNSSIVCILRVQQTTQGVPESLSPLSSQFAEKVDE